MSTATHPNPAEVCKSRGWAVGDKIKVGAVAATELEIMCITGDSIAALDRSGKLHAMGPDRDITHRTKVEPKPRYTVGGHCIYRDGTLLGWISRAAGITHEDYADALRAASIGVDALNGEQTPEVGPFMAKPSATCKGVWRIWEGEFSPFYFDAGRPMADRFGLDAMHEIGRKLTELAAAELNALHAKAKAKAEALRSPTDG